MTVCKEIQGSLGLDNGERKWVVLAVAGTLGRYSPQSISQGICCAHVALWWYQIRDELDLSHISSYSVHSSALDNRMGSMQPLCDLEDT